MLGKEHLLQILLIQEQVVLRGHYLPPFLPHQPLHQIFAFGRLKMEKQEVLLLMILINPLDFRQILLAQECG